ncbi:MAG: sulfotransferase family 2 domain-containing protein [Crocosphaera sp.]|nr:sulfotransferase family 2 domain-containing protein [Crocosphaera sp.]
MILSNSNKFIFIHIPKTGGTSLQKALSKYDSLNHSLLFRAIKKITGLEIYATTYMGELRKINDTKAKSHGHIKDLQRLIPEQMYKEYFKFAVARNPWSWLLSMYKFTKQWPGHLQHDTVINLSFEEYVNWQIDQGKMPSQSRLIIDKNGEFALNYLARLETINQDWEVICKKIGVVADLRRENVSSNRDYRKDYNEKTASLVAEFLKEDIENFGYNFDGIDTTRKSQFPMSQLIE